MRVSVVTAGLLAGVLTGLTGCGKSTTAIFTASSSEASTAPSSVAVSSEASSAAVSSAAVSSEVVSSAAVSSEIVVSSAESSEEVSSETVSSEASSSAAAQNVVLFTKDFEDGDLLSGGWNAISITSDSDWIATSYSGNGYAQMNGYGADTASEDWLISPAIEFGAYDNLVLTFDTMKQYDGPDLEIFYSTDYDGVSDPNTATWTQIVVPLSAGSYAVTSSGPVSFDGVTGTGYVAFKYTSTGTTSGEGAIWQVDNVELKNASAIEAEIQTAETRTAAGEPVTFSVSIAGGKSPYTIEWNFGDGNSATGESVSHTYAHGDDYTVTVTITDSKGATQTAEIAMDVFNVVDVAVPAKSGDLRIATFNVYMYRNELNGLQETMLLTDDDPVYDVRARNVAEIIQRVNPDVVLLNEFDYDETNTALKLFIENFLNVSQNGVDAVDYPYYYAVPSNTGVASGYDFNNDGEISGGDDAYGYGVFEGQYAFAVISKYPILTDQIRTFQNFLWKDMPNAMEVIDEEGNAFYSEEEMNVFRLSSKNHADIPVVIDDKIVHVLASHPTPPIFDGTEDRNGKRNYDEIRLWNDYVNNAAYLYDDNGNMGGLTSNERFVIMGDQNADPIEGDGYAGAINQILIANPHINGSYTPVSLGAVSDGGKPSNTLGDGSTKLRLDYVLPSTYGFDVVSGGVFWPADDDAKYYLVRDINSSDHRMVWMDLDFSGEELSTIPVGTELSLDNMNSLLGTVTFDGGNTLNATWGLGSAAAAGAEAGTVYTLTDRGVNIACSDAEELTGAVICPDDASGSSKIFPFPSFSPSIVKFQIDEEAGSATVKQVINLKDAHGYAVTGVSNPIMTDSGEQAFNIHGVEMQYTPNGLDSEALVMLSDGTFWMAEEYAASLIHVDAQGKVIKRLIPNGWMDDFANASYPIEDTLPGILMKRHANRGIESIAISPDEQYLYFIMQSPLDNPDSSAYAASRNVRLFKIEIANPENYSEYVYMMDLPETFIVDSETKTRAQKDVKISEMLCVGDDQLIILERITATTKLYRVNLQDTETVDAMYDDVATTPTLENSDMSAIALPKTLVFNTDDYGPANGVTFPSKIEGIAPLGDDKFFLINDNDFGIEGADMKGVIVTFDPFATDSSSSAAVSSESSSEATSSESSAMSSEEMSSESSVSSEEASSEEASSSSESAIIFP